MGRRIQKSAKKSGVREIGADGYSGDAATAVDEVLRLVCPPSAAA
jgi:hypothetical protein